MEEEALRDLVRAREDVRGDLMRARQRLSKLLLRHDIVYEDTSSTWTQKHRAWLRAQQLAGGAQATLLDHLGAIDTLELRRGSLETTIAEFVPGSPWAQTIARLRCLRGIDTLSAVGLATEIAILSGSTGPRVAHPEVHGQARRPSRPTRMPATVAGISAFSP